MYVPEGHMMGRCKEDIQEFVLEVVNKAVLDMEEVGNTHEEPLMVSIYGKVQDGGTLDKEESVWLEHHLSNELHNKMDDYMTDRRDWATNLMEVDSLGIYSDAYALYCRVYTN